MENLIQRKIQLQIELHDFNQTKNFEYLTLPGGIGNIKSMENHELQEVLLARGRLPDNPLHFGPHNASTFLTSLGDYRKPYVEAYGQIVLDAKLDELKEISDKIKQKAEEAAAEAAKAAEAAAEAEAEAAKAAAAAAEAEAEAAEVDVIIKAMAEAKLKAMAPPDAQEHPDEVNVAAQGPANPLVVQEAGDQGESVLEPNKQ